MLLINPCRHVRTAEMDAFPPPSNARAPPPVCAAGNGPTHTHRPPAQELRLLTRPLLGYRISRPTARAGSPAAAPPSRNPKGPDAASATRAKVRIAAPAPAGGGAHPPPDEVATRPKTTQPSHPPREHILQRNPRSPAPGGPPVPFLPPWQRRRHPKPVFVTRPVHNTPLSIPHAREPTDESGPPTRGTCTRERERTTI